ncbi:MAG: EAL domain-containing protein, partial [Clostridia bacterium]|nr:EAL domain-containing protein [Clostridia bacterium]
DPNLIEVFNACLPIFIEAEQEGAINKISAGRKSLPAMQLLFRPIYDYNNRQTYGYQIITRLNDKVMGELMPELYVPVAEKSNKISEITKWTIEELCEARNRLELKDRYLGTMFVDLSVKCLTKRYFIENIVKIAKQYNVPTNEFCFIIPEGMLSLDIEKIVPAIAKLKDNGFLVAIGGFGSEYANLASLGEIEFDYLMLGEEFVKNIPTSNRAKKICESVVEMSNKLDTLVVADGVTSKDSANTLFAMGCALMRGKHFGTFIEERYI